MGQKVHPCGFRLGVNKDWQAKWYTGKNYTQFLLDDLKLRRVVEQKCPGGAVARAEIERSGDEVYLTLYSARPGILIGRGGQNVEALKSDLEKVSKDKIRLTIREVEHPELEAILVARSIAGRLEERIPFRRAMRQAAFRTSQAGAKGVKIMCSGRLGGAEIARTETLRQGQMPLHKLRANIDYGFAEAHTLMGRIGVKVWIYKGDIIPETEVKSVTTETSEIPQGT
ncbi:MAG: 30S ribosomal protein S3 [Dehalococcoidia bacterium]|nr:30S ribosomal protein S3 [Dehalococcoidia bacterium]RLC65289.1 MAG: 30S ribosomal protein S3 [Chloroflexota bacterium]